MSDSINEKSENTSETADNSAPTVKEFYRVVWRWHFYAGLFVVPFMLMLSVTGIIYLFKPQLDGVMYRNLLFVAAQSATLPPTAQLESVQRKYPSARIKNFTPNPAPERSSQFEIVTEDKRNLLVFVSPYTAEILGDYDKENNLQAYAVLLHGELMIGKIGDWLIELAACWALVLLVSGLYLWLPRTGNRIWGTLLPRLNLKNKRIFWRDLHAVTGFYAVLIIGFIILTGLPWAGFWGTNFARIWSQFPAEKDGTVFKSDVKTGSLNTTNDKKVAWAVEQMPMPKSDEHAGHQTASNGEIENNFVAKGVGLDSIVAVAQTKTVAAGYTIALPKDENGVYTISAPTGDPFKQTTIHVDQYTGAILADVRWKDYGAVPKAVEMGIALHEGKYFGLPNQILMLLAALSVILLAVSGIIMWWQRRPANRLGAPPMPENFPLWKTAAAIIIVMGVLFPLVGISLIFVLLLDYLVIQRIPKLKQIKG